MPLSEHEQRLLDEMERNLYGGNPDVVQTPSSATKPHAQSVVIGSLLAVAGVIGLVLGVVMQIIVVSIVGFVVMFVGVLLATRRRQLSQGERAKPARPQRASFMQRMEERWDNRQDDRL